MSALGNRNVPVCWTRRLLPREHADRAQPLARDQHPSRTPVLRVRVWAPEDGEATYVVMPSHRAAWHGTGPAGSLYAACEAVDALIPGWVRKVRS